MGPAPPQTAQPARAEALAASLIAAPQSPAATTSQEAGARAEHKSCHAAVSPELQRELNQRAANVRSCYVQLLQADETRGGAVVVSVRMSGHGRFDEARLSEDEIGDPEFAQCVLSNFRAPTGSPIDGDCVDVNIPLRLVPQKPPPASGNPDPAPKPSG
jgi:hypothetical protein